MRDIPKCPECGSTAQVRLTGEMELITNNNSYFFQQEIYECGCGCAFRLEMAGKVKVEVLE